jgi:hypothetical protein
MAHTITLSDGTTTANLHALTATFVEARGWQFAGGGGAEEVGESLDLVMTAPLTGTQAAAVTTLQAAVATIERLLDSARRRAATGIGDAVYLTVQLDSEASAWRSEVTDGRLDMLDAADRLHTRRLRATLGVTRFNYWEYAANDIELQLSANGQAAATGGRTVTNTATALWVQIAAAQVTGSLPTPLRIELQNTSGASRTFADVHLALNVDNNPTGFTHYIEGEAATSGGTTVASAPSSGDNMRSVTVNTSAEVTWTITASQVQDAGGAPFLLLARLQSLTGAVAIRPELRYGATVIWRAHQARTFTRTTPQLAVLGMIPLPPIDWDSASNGALTLALVFESAASRTVGIDFLALFPSAPTNYRLLTMLGASVPNSSYVIDNAVAGWAAARIGGFDFPVASPRGLPLMLRPNAVQEVYILQQTTTDMATTDTFSVRAYYRPRRQTL